MKSKTTTIEETEERQDNNGKIKELLSWAFTFLAAILMALFIKTFIIINLYEVYVKFCYFKNIYHFITERRGRRSQHYINISVV